MAIGVTLQISIKGIPTTLKFDINTAEWFRCNYSAMLQRYPDGFTELAAGLRSTTIAFCAYHIYCKDIRASATLTFDDFFTWATEQSQTEEGRQMLNKINDLFSTISMSK